MIIQCASTKADLTKTTVLDSLLKDLQQEEPGVWIKEAVSCFLRVVLQDSNYYASTTNELATIHLHLLINYKLSILQLRTLTLHKALRWPRS